MNNFLKLSECLREGFNKKIIEFSIKGWVGGSGGSQILFKKRIKKNMTLKSILGHLKPF